ncbi:anti-sigma factor [Demequina sp. TTPB684]|uniref:anti-sigma factor n=1 Tax=unclassified Demequina TaxID=2620311 RepID=UPI001CF1B729|nr:MULTISPECIES: anti-sigma factor [unclassified Demequina]MCB2413006.1 anti-sigma factor [Demequina sp. TTPB684]UPU87075.1 anti-sigma factor [Demequina sp. TMPB413]
MNEIVDDPHSLLGPYVVGAVDDVERKLFENHLRDCADCRAELAGMSDVVAIMVDAEATPPPAALRAAVREQVSRTAQLPPSVPSAPRVQTSGRRRRWPLAGAVAAAAIAVAGIGAYLTSADSPDASALEREVMMVSSAPDAHTMELGLGSSHLVMSERMNGVALMGVDAPAPADGMEYQLWVVIDGGEMMPGPTFMPDRDGEFMAVMHTGFEGVTDFKITEEPYGGSDSPTGEAVAGVSL